MRGKAKSNQSRVSRRKGRTKAKSCDTCKVRKVKCDESFPACRRCISTGRVCDGYGVWGGGSSYDVVSRHMASKAPSSISLLTTASQDKYYFEWFKCRTSQKVPGLFVLNFWSTLVFQASLSEPAVLHALLAFSSIHKDGNTYRKGHECPDELEKLMLSNYSKAISHLKPHFSSKDRSSVRVALITCVLFVCVEAFRGHFKTAQTHLQNGLKVLGELQHLSSANGDGIHLLQPCLNPTDDWIVEMFSRLQIEVTLFHQSIQYPGSNFQCSELRLPPTIYCSLNEAWQELERILNQIVHLADRSREKQNLSSISRNLLLTFQQRIKAELTQWLCAYEASREALRGVFYPGYEDFAFQLLCTYHTLANIMADSCLYPYDESIYDSLANQFVTLIDLSVKNWNIGLPDKEFEILAVPKLDLSRSVMDIGWIPPLYYTALKCRVHRLRLQAIKFLELSPHREGIWDGQIAACIARKVMEIEERDFYIHIDSGDDFEISSTPKLRDLSLPTLPQSYRINDIKVNLPDGPADNLFLSYRRKQSGGDVEEVTQEFNFTQRYWTEIKSEKAKT
ncbi:hypothetical protein N431DRAFT_325965 [Stipitochalara longipes BDJ]|nr:hypothetical protein N431DRAFT_325965 [Stipitochalara longipes BDJ]